MIVLSNLQKSLGSFRLLIEQLEIQPGEYLVILGPSGAGKSVLLLTVAGLIRPDSGQLFFNGGDVTGLPPEKRDVGLVFQEANLFPHLTVAKNIAFGKRYRRKRAAEIQQRVELLIDMLNIRPLLYRTVEGLSGGEKQRVAIARALSIGPTILLLDEPLGLLDQNTREELRKELRRVHDELRTTTLHVTHDRSEAFTMADRIAILNEGRLAQVGPREEIFTRPASEFVARFLGVENVLDAFAEQDASGRTFLRIGESRLPAPSQYQGRVRFCVRPEDVSLHPHVPPRTEAAASLSGTVKSIEDRGAVLRLVVNCPVGDVVVLCGKQQFLGSGLSCSSSVWLRLNAASIHVLPRPD
ncbi:MAG: ABC transporter ATP-binding protein [bacterium]|nr:ABC transporter ATP-binding protein [bacterium]